MTGLTHIDREGNAVMVDVSEKGVTGRTATAEGLRPDGARHARPDRGARLQEGRRARRRPARRHHGGEAHQRPHPLCHPLALSAVKVELEPDRAAGGVRIRATCRVSAQTGVEMEALTAVSVAALTVYDMCKAVDRGMRIADIRLLHKAGGRSGEWRAEDA